MVGGSSTVSHGTQESDIDLYKLNYNSGSWTTGWHQVYANALFQANRYYDDVGPYDPSGIGSGCTPGHSSLLDNIFAAPSQNAPADLLISKFTNNIFLFSYISLVSPFEDPVYNTNGGINDCSRPLIPTSSTENTYEALKDAQGFVLQVDYSTGNLIITGTNDNPIHTGHYSGDDFTLGMTEDNCGNIYTVGTMAANNLGTKSIDLTIPVLEDALLSKISSNHDRLWRRNFNSPGLHQSIGTDMVMPYSENCPFAITLNPEDNSVVIAGNNGERNDDYLVIKLTNDDQQLYTGWSNSSPVIDIYGTPAAWTAPQIIKGKVIVHFGATLTIDNTTIEFGETREMNDYNEASIQPCGIWVQPGGRLIVKNNAILRGLSNHWAGCGKEYMWDGITLEGDPSVGESFVNQGTLSITNGATILDARCGVRCDSKHFFNNEPEITVVSDQTSDRGRLSYASAEGKGGGYIFANSCKFQNCRKGVEILPYTYQPSLNSFYTTHFVGTGPMVDPDYVYWNTAANRYSNAGINTHVSIWDAHKIPFNQDIFENSGSFDWENSGAGISTVDADYSVTNNCNFKLLTYGIFASSYSSGATIDVEGNIFSTNHAGVYNYGIELQTVVNNQFNVGSFGKLDYGIYLGECTNYTIQQNRMVNINPSEWPSFGIIDYISRSNGNDDIIYNNYFENFYGAAALAEGYHNDGGSKGLQLKCNEYNLNLYDEFTPDILTGPGQGIRSEQGSPIPTGAANNIFTTTCTVSEGELHNEASTDVQIYKYHHDANGGGSITEPDVVNCITPGWVVPNNLGTPFERAADCPNKFRIRDKDEIKDEMRSDKEKKDSLEQMTNENSAGTQMQAMNHSEYLSNDEFNIDSINSLISYYNSEYNQTLNELIDLYLSDTTINGIDSVIFILQSENSKERKIELMQDYLSINHFSSASAILNDLQQYPELSNYVEIENDIIQLKQLHASVYSIKSDPMLYDRIIHIANDSMYAGYAEARIILSIIDEKRLPEIIIFDRNSPTYRKKKDEAKFASGEILLRNFPNPFSSGTTIEVQVNDKLNNPELIITEITGRTVAQYILQKGFNQVTVSSSLIKPGIYLYSLVSDEKKISTGRMISTQ